LVFCHGHHPLAGRLSLCDLVEDHPPAHVHAYHGDGFAIVEIETLFVRRYVNMKPKDVVKAVRIVKQNAGKFAMEWRRIHGS
jgi:hypothetical protein